MPYDDTDRGVLFRNKDKATDRHPDYKGSINVGGKDYWISGWIKTAGPAARNPGTKFMNLAVNIKDQQIDRNAENNKAPTDFDEDIPF